MVNPVIPPPPSYAKDAKTAMASTLSAHPPANVITFRLHTGRMVYVPPPLTYEVSISILHRSPALAHRYL
jgi:hypothetical protein